MKNYIYIIFIAIALIIGGCSQYETAGPEQNIEEKNINYPEKSIELIVPFDAGGGLDTAARILAEAAEKHLPNNQAIVVINRPGGTGTVGITSVSNAKPDGYTIGIAPYPPLLIAPHFGEVSYNTKEDLQPIINVGSTPQFMTVRKDSPWTNAEEWLDYVKENPGELHVGSNGPTSAPDLTMSLLNREAGIEVVMIPYTGGGPQATALLAGEIDGALITAAAGNSEEFRKLFVVTPNRSYSFPDVPSINEITGLDVAFENLVAIIGPNGLSEEIVEVIHNAFKNALDDESVQEKLLNAGIDPDYRTTDELKSIFENDWDNNKELLTQLGLIEK